MSETKKVQTFHIDAEERTSTFLNPIIHNGELAYKKTTKTERYSQVHGAYKVAQKVTEIVSFESVHPELKTSIDVPIIIKRVAVDTDLVRNIEAFFKTVSHIEVNNPIFKLSLSDGKPFLHGFDGMPSCQSISPVLPDSRIYTISIDEDMKKISVDEILALIRQGVQVFHENPSSRNQRDRFRVVLQEA